jgi:hypothetical protein
MSADLPTPVSAGPVRALIAGWFSFVDGEATAGDVLAAAAVEQALTENGLAHDTAWSPVFRPDALHLDAAAPERYSHLVFACGPLHAIPPDTGRPSPLLELHRRYRRLRRIAVGVSVPDPADPAVRGFHCVLPRDGPSVPVPSLDLAAAAPPPAAVPVVGVILTEGQREYGGRRRHAAVGRALTGWLRNLDAARLRLDTRLAHQEVGWPETPAQLHAVLSRLDAVVTTRLHGLVLGLRAGVPVLAVDPVAGGAKVAAQARALDWPAVLRAEQTGPAELDRWWRWCRSASGRELARATCDRMLGLRPLPQLTALIAAVRDVR